VRHFIRLLATQVKWRTLVRHFICVLPTHANDRDTTQLPEPTEAAGGKANGAVKVVSQTGNDQSWQFDVE